MTYSRERVVELGSVAEREYQTVYVLDGITYLPHKRAYLDECEEDGCLAGVVHSVREAVELVDKFVKEEICG